MKLVFSKDAWADYLYWQEHDREGLIRVNEIIRDVLRSPFNGIGAQEVERYVVWPGQACAYKIGQTEILRQRELARTALGARFDLRAFNQAVVDGGNCPLDVLGGNVARFIADAKTENGEA